MTTINGAVLTEEQAKKRTYALRGRATELGYALSMGHAYDLMASAHGYRDWATMRPAISKSVTPAAVLSEEVSRHAEHQDQFLVLGNLRGVPDGQESGSMVGIPLADLSSHVEVFASSPECRALMLVRLAESAIGAGVGSATFYKGGWGAALHLASVAGKSGGQTHVIDLCGREVFRGEDLEVIELLDAETLEFFWRCYMAAFLEGENAREVFRWMDRFQHLSKGVAGLAAWLRSRGEVVDVERIKELSSLETVYDVCTSARYAGMPSSVANAYLAYRRGLLGVDWSDRDKLSRTERDEHSFLQTRLEQSLVELMRNTASVCWPKKFDLVDAVLSGENIIVAMPSNVRGNRMKWTISQTILMLVSKLALVRENIQTPFMITVDSADHFDQVDLQQRMVDAKDANCCFAISSELPLPYPVLKGAYTVHVSARSGRKISATLVSRQRAVEFSFSEPGAGDE